MWTVEQVHSQERTFKWDEKQKSDTRQANLPSFFSVKKDTLLYYDKIKLFCPAGVGENGYRFYTSSQIDTFWTLLSLRELDVPIKSLKTYFQNPSPKNLLEMMDAQLDVVEQQIKKLQKIRWLMNRVSHATREAETAELGVVRIEILPERFYVYSEPLEQTSKTTEQHWSDVFDHFVRTTDLMGATYVGSVISKADLESRRFGRVDRLFAESISKKGTVRAGGMYAVYYHKGDYDSIPAICPSLLQQVHNLGYSVIGDAYEEYLIAETATNSRKDFVTKISIAVEKRT